MAAGAQNARRFIERGLASYGQGDVQHALGQWREALRIDPGNDEAQKLVAFVEERMSAKTPTPPAPQASREPSPLPPLHEAVLEATRNLHEEEDERPEGERKRRATLVSALPELLAPSTLPDRNRRTVTMTAAVDPDHKMDGVVRAPTPDVITRPVGNENVTPKALNALSRTATPLDLALAQARDRGKLLVRQCGEALSAGKADAAAAAAEEALEEAEKAPSPGIVEIIEPARATFERAFLAHLGRPGAVPTMAVDDATVNASNFDHRTGFLLSCIDGTLPIDTLIDISGMGRFEAVRTLSRLLRRRIIKLGA